MFNLNSVVAAFNLTTVDVGSYKDRHGFVLTYRPIFSDMNYGSASTTFVDAEDLFNNIVNYNELKIKPIVTKSMINFVERLEAVKEKEKEYALEELLSFVTKYENQYSSNKYDELKFYATIRQEILYEFNRLGMESSTLKLIYSAAEEALFYRKDYNS